MGRRTPAIRTRDKAIARHVLTGTSCRALAAEYGVSTARIQQIVHAECRRLRAVPPLSALPWQAGPSLATLRRERWLYLPGLEDTP